MSTPPVDLPPADLPVAAVQACPTPGEVAANASLAARLARRAAGTRVVVLPELFLCAYHPPTLYREDPVLTHVAADDSGSVADARLDPLRSVAADQGAIVVVGAAVRHPDGRRTCSSLVVSPEGTITAAYEKQNLWGPDERALFTPGSRGVTLLVDGWRLGLGICYDGCFPEHGRAAAVDGAHAYLCPAGFLDGSQHRRDVYYAARALDNTMYVVFANSVGGDPPLRFNGGAAIYDPEGRPIAKAPDEGDAMVTAVLVPSVLERARAAHTMLLDRPVDAGGARLVLPV